MTTKEEALKDVITLPHTIKEKELKILKDKQRIDELHLKLALLRRNVTEEVLNATKMETKGKDETPKSVKAFSNAEQREIEIDKRMSAHVSVNDELKKLEADLAIADIELGYFKRRFRSLEAFLNGGTRDAHV